MPTLSTTQTGASAEYLRYSYGTITKTDRASDPTLLDFRLLPFDTAFVKLTRGAYITLNTGQYGVWFTGFITNDAELEYVGSNMVAGVRTPHFGYIYQATSDVYLLNLKPIGIIPPFVNTTQGAVLRYLIRLLTPAGWSFDVSGITNGQTIARYIVDPAMKFSEVVKVFCDASNSQFRLMNRIATYIQQDVALCGITVDGTSKHFTPSNLSLKPVADPVVNDSIILGDIEPQTYFNEYFVGDGITAAFPLVNSVYGVDSTIILDDDFSGSTIDNSKWTLYDTANAYFQPLNGFLNILGGNNTGDFAVYIQSQSLLPLEGNLRLTHGEYDFIQASDGIVASLWTQSCSSNLSNCLYGLRATASGANTTLRPIVNGVVDTTQSLVIDYTQRYNIRTLFGADQAIRLTANHSFRNVDGSVGNYGGTSKVSTSYFQTIITALDPTTGLQTGQVTFMNGGITLTAAQTYAYYCPAVSNNLHLTLTGVTISSPMQTKLEIQLAKTTGYLQKLMGPNEINALDGLAPVATVIDSNSGITAKSTVLGSRLFNSGQATLAFFKDTTHQATQTPQVGDLLHLSYRIPGAAIGRVQNAASLVLESQAFRDDGVRTAVIHDMSPLPRSAEECEQAAAAYVAMYGYQHYQGTYKMPSGPWFTSEPLSGTILKFVNTSGLGGFPAYLQAEAVTEVLSTLDGRAGVHVDGNLIAPKGYGQTPTSSGIYGDTAFKANTESFTHTLTFGPVNKLSSFLGTLKSRQDVFVRQDTAEIPTYVNPASVGLSKSVDIVSPRLVSWSPTAFNFDIGMTLPVGTQFEARYSNKSWGADPGGNLAARSASSTFSIPRNARGRIIYLRAYDTRNQLLYSEDLSNSVWTPSSATITRGIGKMPNNSSGFVSTISGTTTNSLVTQVLWNSIPNQTVTFSVSVLGIAGQIVYLQVNNGIDDISNSPNVVLVGGWQRISWTHTFNATVSPNYAVTLHVGMQTVQATNFSLELGPQETAYCKTLATSYGALSRYSAGIRVAFPNIPPAPSATLNYNDPLNPVINVKLPTVLQDVWGIEIRAADNTTVLNHANLVDAGYVPQYILANNTSRSISIWLYTYNLLGEYSIGVNTLLTIPPPTATNLAINNGKLLSWTDSTNTLSTLVEIDITSAAFSNKSLNALTFSNVWSLNDTDFFNNRWIRVTPSDALGAGAPSTVIQHQYTPSVVAEFNGNEVASVPAPSSLGFAPILPVGHPFLPVAPVVISKSFINYATNKINR